MEDFSSIFKKHGISKIIRNQNKDGKTGSINVVFSFTVDGAVIDKSVAVNYAVDKVIK